MSKETGSSAVEREILRPLWKVHILHHACEAPFVANWMIEELREHGYRVSPGTLYPMLTRLCRLGWLKTVEQARAGTGPAVTHYQATSVGRRALREVQARIRELQGEVFRKR
ncbi:MAG: helix-turn-helix transcriptional regulator [Opitutaceae bacterium]|nr:helix-turn-helix transcriptional regulator [Opitutaceae bacterium]